MPILRRFFLALLTLALSWTAYAEQTRYITDELHTFLRIGPGERYRLAGTISAGEAVTLLAENPETGYAQIRDANGKESWIPLSQLSTQPSLRIRVPELEKQVQTLTSELKNINDSWNNRTAEMQKKVANSDQTIASLQKENGTLKSQLQSAQTKADAVNAQFDDKKREVILQWFLYGGGVAVGGLLLGLLLPHIIPRKKNKRWMN